MNMTVTETMTLILAVIMTMNVIECVCENNYMTLTRAWICNYDYVIGFVCECKYYYYHKLECNCVFSYVCDSQIPMFSLGEMFDKNTIGGFISSNSMLLIISE